MSAPLHNTDHSEDIGSEFFVLLVDDGHGWDDPDHNSAPTSRAHLLKAALYATDQEWEWKAFRVSRDNGCEDITADMQGEVSDHLECVWREEQNAMDNPPRDPNDDHRLTYAQVR